MFFYSDKSREGDKWSLPDCETIYEDGYQDGLERGWYYRFCFPGCMPDSEPYGPYETEEKAMQECRLEHNSF